jgi:excinuclease ABC subunit B
MDIAYRITLWGDDIETLHTIDPFTGQRIEELDHLMVWPANLFVTGKDAMKKAMTRIQDDLMDHVGMLEKEGQRDVAKRIKERTEFDLEMMRELGYCTGIENYSRYFDGRIPGQRPFCLLDYFPDDFLLVVDESHVTLPQVRAMWGGDRSRKVNLVDYGFRLPAALDNRPLTFSEFEEVTGQTLFVSATPGDYELQQAEGVVVEQVIRPTGLLDPKIDVRPSLHQIDDFIEQAQKCIENDERVLATTLTKRMAEELSKYLDDVGMKAKYIHSEVNVVDRVEILRELRLGVFDILVGVNLLREGLDLPEVSLVVVFDADKEGFLRNHRSLIQTIGRAARNAGGRVIMYADKVTGSMERAIDETNRRRSVQDAYNQEHGITPTTVKKSKEAILGQTAVADSSASSYVSASGGLDIAADPVVAYMGVEELEKLKAETKRRMEKAAKDLDFVTAAQHRDELFALEEKVKKMTK